MTDKELLDRMKHGSFSPEQLDELKRHINVMTDDEINNIIDSYGFEPSLPDPEAAKKVREKLDDVLTHSLIRYKMRRWLSVAAVIMLPFLLAGTIYFYTQSVKYDAYSEVLSSDVSIVTSPDENLTVVLPDGSRVSMAPESNLAYSMSDFSDKGRFIRFKGDAFFDVAANSGTTFVIETKGMTVTVKGTSFMLMSRDTAPSASLYLESGSVTVRSVSTGNEITLKPGEFVSVLYADGAMSVSTVDNRNDARAMGRGDLIFSGASIIDVMDSLGKVYGITYENMNNSLLNEEFTGYIPSTDFGEAVRIIEYAFDCTIEEKSDSVVIIH